MFLYFIYFLELIRKSATNESSGSSLKSKSVPTKLPRNTDFTPINDISSNPATTKSLKNVKSFEVYTNVSHSVKVEVKNLKSDFSGNLNVKNDDSKAIAKEKMKKKAEDEFVDSFFEEPKKLVKELSDGSLMKKKKDKEKDKEGNKNKDNDKLDKEGKSSDKERSKKIIKMEKLDRLELNKSSESNSTVGDMEADVQKKSKKTSDETDKLLKSKKIAYIDEIVKEKKFNEEEQKLGKKVATKNKAEVVFLWLNNVELLYIKILIVIL